MFDELLESRGTRERRSRVGVVSACLHAALIVGAAVATSRAEPPPPAPDDLLPEVVYRVRPEPRHVARAGSDGGARVDAAPVRPLPPVPPVNTGDLPPVDVDLGAVIRSGPTADPLLERGAEEGAEGRAGQPGGVYAPGDRYVEKPALAAPGSPQPRYPEMLRQAGVEGEVEAEFVVDTLGRAEPGSLRILRSDHDLFAAAVRSALPTMRFLPAEAGGRRVRQLVRQPFSFTVR